MSTQYKRIRHYTSTELDEAVETAVLRIPNFYTLLHGVDAYMERRKRKEEKEAHTAPTTPEEKGAQSESLPAPKEQTPEDPLLPRKNKDTSEGFLS